MSTPDTVDMQPLRSAITEIEQQIWALELAVHRAYSCIKAGHDKEAQWILYKTLAPHHQDALGKPTNAKD